MGLYVDVVVNLTRKALTKGFEVVSSRDEASGNETFSIGGLPVQFGRDVAAIRTLCGPSMTVQGALSSVDKVVPGLVDDLPFNQIAVTCEHDGLAADARFLDLAADGVSGEGLLAVRHKAVVDVLKAPAAGNAADDWLDTIEIDGDGQLRQASPSEGDIDAKAEAFLQSMSRDAIMRALRSQRVDE